MRGVIQRVTRAAVSINGNPKATIEAGLLVLAAIEDSDNDDDVIWMSGKIVRLRIFNDETGVMNRSVLEINGGILLISQFTLFASIRKGNRPSYSRSARSEIAIPIYQRLIGCLEREMGKVIQTGEFGTDMQISLTNDGPVTIIIDSKRRE